MLLAGIQETGTEHFTHIKHVTITQQRLSVISHGRYEVRKFIVFVVFEEYFSRRKKNQSKYILVDKCIQVIYWKVAKNPEKNSKLRKLVYYFLYFYFPFNGYMSIYCMSIYLCYKLDVV